MKSPARGVGGVGQRKLQIGKAKLLVIFSRATEFGEVAEWSKAALC
ncbi:MAG TPA: hypothetical protein VGH08_11775 [Chthoniobacterales bacterium]